MAPMREVRMTRMVSPIMKTRVTRSLLESIAKHAISSGPVMTQSM